ncbi:MAG: AMP-binding protein [Bacteroidota bacterium]
MTASTLDPVRAAAQRTPEAPALVLDDGPVSYTDLDAQVGGAAAWLEAHDLRAGDRLAILAAPSPDLIALLWGCWRAGVVAAPLSLRLPDAALADLIERLSPAALVTDWPDAAFSLPTYPLASRRAAQSTRPTLDPRPSTFDPRPSTFDPRPSTFDPRPPTLDLRPWTLIHTSGSSGTPKAALHTWANHLWSARGWIERLRLGPQHRWWLDLPLYHVGGLAILVRCALAGAAAVLALPKTPLPEAVRRYGVTHASLVATQLRRALDAATPADLDALRGMDALLLGGSAIPEDVLREAYDARLPVLTSYGMTEMTSTVTATPPDASFEALCTAGAVLPHREVRLADDGEILVRGRTRFAGYLDDAALTEPFDADGWFGTRDVGAWVEVDGQRLLRVIGRTDRMFISGGENIQPEAIEAALLRLPGVRRAAVVPIADAEFGHRPVAFVEADIDLGALRTMLDVPGFMRPVAVLPWPADLVDGMKPDLATLQRRAAVAIGG